MPSIPVVQYASRTDVGMRRAANQDSLAVRLCPDFEEWQRCGHLFVVADGMGGHAVGDLASRIAVDTLPHAYFKQDAPSIESRMRQAVQTANKAINDRGRENREFEGMGTTCSVLSLAESGAYVGHVGDSRVYRVRQNRIEQLTFDHSLQWEMIRLGRATIENVELFHPRNVITRCLGPDPAVQIDVEGPFSIEAGDHFVLCSDGLTNHVSDTEIGQIVASLPPAESSRLLINLANCRGGSDNSTVVVAEITSYPKTLPEQTAAAVKNRSHGETIDAPRRNASLPKLLLAVTAVLCLLGAILLLVLFSDKKIPSAILIIAAVLSWLISHRMKEKSSRKLVGNIPNSESIPTIGPNDSSSDPSPAPPPVPKTPFNLRSPYRIMDAGISEALLSQLAEMQSDLTQTARDSAWDVDFTEITILSRQANSARQSGQLDRSIKSRAKAIDMLMREMYSRSRSI
ncbi:MAG TPA: protein phosphatase 2C domain-containing protein [Planctomycetaceae bacterium]|nr:protein phosphatase 2C domain-containing protein [Planctomycetaceae bacterium]